MRCGRGGESASRLTRKETLGSCFRKVTRQRQMVSRARLRICAGHRGAPWVSGRRPSNGFVGTVKVATNVGVGGAKLASDGISGGAKFVSKHRDTIASVATTAVDATATAVAVTGAVVLTGAAGAAKTLTRSDPDPWSLR